LHQVGDLFELNIKLRCQKVKGVFQVAGPASAFCVVGSCSLSVLTVCSGRIPHNARKCGVEQIKPFGMCTVRSGHVFL